MAPDLKTRYGLHLMNLRLALFREECYKGWLAQSWGPQLFNDFGQKEERTQKLTQEPAFQFALRNEAFIAKQDAEYVGFGHDVGGQVGRGITQYLLEQPKLPVLSLTES